MVLIILAIAVLAAWLQLGEQPSLGRVCGGMALIALALSLRFALPNMKPAVLEETDLDVRARPDLGFCR